MICIRTNVCYNVDGCLSMFKKIYVELTNVCNLHCSFCKGNQREKRYMSIEEFSIILKRLHGHTKYLYFHVMGEPLMHPLLNQFIDMASKNFFINITTNGYLINRIASVKKIRQVNISLHSFSFSYNKSLEEYLETIFDSVSLLVQNGTIINYRLWVDSPYGKEIKLALEKKYKVSLTHLKGCKLASHIYFEEEEEFLWPALDNDYYSENGSCMGCRTHIGILVDGTVVPCCLDSEGVISLGNIYKQELNDIISGDLFKKMREGFLNNKKIHPLCKKCNFYTLRK